MMLAASDVSDWFELAVGALVIGGSVIAAVIKGTREALDQKREADKKKLRDPASRKSPGRERPVHPAARPMPPRISREEPYLAERPTARPMPHPVEAPPWVPPNAAGAEGGRYRPPDAPVSSPPRPPSPKRRRRSERQPALAEATRRKAPIERTRESETATHEPRHAAVRKTIEHTMDDKAQDEISGKVEAIRSPTRQALRRAIVLNEILAPPLALRDREAPL